MDLTGELASSVQDGLLSASEQASSEGARVLILNFSHLVYKNSSRIKSVVALLARCKAAEQRLFAVGLNDIFRGGAAVALERAPRVQNVALVTSKNRRRSTIFLLGN